MKTVVVVVLSLLFAVPAFAKEATFANGVVKFDTVTVGTDTYEAELTLVPAVTPATFVVTTARKVASTTTPAATFVGTTLTVPNILINGNLRASAKLILTGQNPLRFQLNSYSVLRSVTLEAGHTLKAGKAFYLSYTGGVLASAKVQLKAGTTVVPASVLDNSIGATVPGTVTGSQTLSITLDGDSFQLPVTIEASTPIANPKTYVTGYVNELAVQLQNFNLPSGLLDTKTLGTQLTALSEAEAQQVALQVRENLESLLSEVTKLQSGNLHALSVFTPTANLTECERLQVNYMRAWAVVSLGSGMAAGGAYAAGTGALTGVGAIVTAISVSAGIVAAELALRYHDQLLSFDCRQARNATITTANSLRSDIVLTTAIDAFENRAKTIQIAEQFQLADTEVRSTFLATSASLKAALNRTSALLLNVGFSSSNTLVTTLTALAARIKTDDTLLRSDNAHKYVIRAISDSRISGSVLSTRAGTLTLLLDKKDEEIADGKFVNFTIELYNVTEDISITVPVKLNGASLLEDLKLAVLGEWSVVNVQNGTTYTLELRSGGNGVYKVKATSCATGANPVAGICDYKMTWNIAKSGTQYVLYDNGFWHPAYQDPAITGRTGLTLPVTGFVVHTAGDPTAVGIRYTKL